MAGTAKSRKAALGFRTHSGWASAILAAGRGDTIEILDRRLIALCDSTIEGAKQPFHAAEPMSFAQAESHIALCRKATIELARDAIKTAQMICARQGVRLSAICVIAASGRVLPDLSGILASHALIHTAEGEFYRDALLRAAEAMDIVVNRLIAQKAAPQVASLLNIGEDRLAEKLGAIGKRVGRPWTSDEKLATLAAWLMLAK